jgi:hypothetical protein
VPLVGLPRLKFETIIQQMAARGNAQAVGEKE